MELFRQDPWWTKKGVAQIGTLNPYIRTQAETIAWEKGVKTKMESRNNVYVTDINNGDYIKVRGVNFGTKGAGTFYARVASASKGGTIELHLDSVNGTKIGSLPVSNTGGWMSWKLKETSIHKAVGVHDMYLVFKGNPGAKLFNFDYWRFGKSTR